MGTDVAYDPKYAADPNSWDPAYSGRGAYSGVQLAKLGMGQKHDGAYWSYDPNAIYKNPDRAEWARQVAIKLGTHNVNSIYDDPARKAQQQAFLASMRDFYTSDLNRQQAIAARNRKFSTARGGLTGGSADVDSKRLLGENYNKGLLDAETKAQGAYSDLVGRDEASRLDLLASVRAGMDSTTAAARSAAAMRDNASAAQTQAIQGGLGDAFGSTAALYKQQQDAADRRRGMLDAYGSIYGTKNPYGS